MLSWLKMIAKYLLPTLVDYLAKRKDEKAARDAQPTATEGRIAPAGTLTLEHVPNPVLPDGLVVDFSNAADILDRLCKHWDATYQFVRIGDRSMLSFTTPDSSVRSVTGKNPPACVAALLLYFPLPSAQ